MVQGRSVPLASRDEGADMGGACRDRIFRRKGRPRGTLLLLAAAVGILGCAPLPLRSSPEPRDASVADSELAAEVALAFHEARLEGRHEIRIQASGSTVSLEGPVSDAAAGRAVALARGVRGVEAVAFRRGR